MGLIETSLAAPATDWTQASLLLKKDIPALKREEPTRTDVVDCFRIRLARNDQAHLDVSELLKRMYATRGYQCQAISKELAQRAKTFVATDRGHSVGTLTVGLDIGRKLFVDELFSREVDAIRDAGLKVCEFGKLAMDRRAGRSPELLAALFHVAYIYARKVNGLDRVLIEVNPRHVRYYEAMLGFKVIGPERHNPRVEAPAVLLALDLNHAQEQIELLGGHPELSATERSAYPHFFTQADEAGIEQRLYHEQDELIEVLKRARRPHHVEVDEASAATH